MNLDKLLNPLCTSREVNTIIERKIKRIFSQLKKMKIAILMFKSFLQLKFTSKSQL